MSKKATESKQLSLFKREVLAIIFMAIGSFLYLSLFTYQPLDPSLLGHTTDTQAQNWGGMFGAYCADIFLVLFGGGAYFVGLYFIIIAVLFFIGFRKKILAYEIPVYLLFILFVSVFCQLNWGVIRFEEENLAAGGILGSLIANTGERYLGRPGTYLVVSLGAVMTFILVTRLSLIEIFRHSSKNFGKYGEWLTQKLSIYWARFIKLFSKQIEIIKLKIEERKKRKEELEKLKQEKKNQIIINQQEAPLPRLAVKIPNPPVKQEPIEPQEPISKALAGPKIYERKDEKPKISAQLELQNISRGYQLPNLSLLDLEENKVQLNEETLTMNARILEKKLMDFNVEGKVTEIHPGPVITMYEFQPAAGVKLSRISNLVDDLSLAMEGRSVRIEAPLPNKAAVGIEIPNNERETVWLKEVLASDAFRKASSKLTIGLGKDIGGTPYVGDISKMPHVLVAGATGAGKSVCINSIIISLLYSSTPEEVRLLMVDPKMLELSIYENIPHLLLPVVTDPKKASIALRWAVREMERRYRLMSDINVRNLAGYNKKMEKDDYESRSKIAKEKGMITGGSDEVVEHEGKMPFIVIIIDELADLMMVASKEVEESIARLAQMARAAGIHLILATQRPSVDVLTGVIKANFPARISFKVSAKHDSRTILDAIGAERLLGNGDMLFMPPGASKIVRLHGAFISDAEVGRVVDHVKKQGKPVYDESILKPQETEVGEFGASEEGENDNLYDQAVALVSEAKQASISLIQRRLRIGYNRAARMIEQMESEGIVSAPSHSGKRQVLVSSFGES